MGAGVVERIAGNRAAVAEGFLEGMLAEQRATEFVGLLGDL